MKNILNLNNEEAKEFLLAHSSYINFDMPPYFDFGVLLKKLSTELNGKSITDFYDNGINPSSCEGVNYTFLNNKSGPYDWRPFEIIHPALYVDIVQQITEINNWESIRELFNTFAIGSVECTSIPAVSQTNKSDKAEQISNWWREFEQKSIVFGLEYDYLYETDVTNCYGSIYTHSIPWALHGKDFAKVNRNDLTLLGNNIDKTIQGMSYGQTNGIPQGSILMDFIAEMVLGYADKLLSDKITIRKKHYKILRYRDDYRIFVNSPQIGEEILKNLTEVLYSLGLGLSDGKTKNSNDVVKSSIKEDKYFWLLNRKNYDSIGKQLLVIKKLADKFPNSGSVAIALDELDQKLEKAINGKQPIKENIEVLISIVVAIMYKNPRVYPVATSMLSKLIASIKNTHNQISMIKKIIVKFNRVPNVGHLELWLQRMTLKVVTQIYDEKLCKRVNDPSIEIWNSSWVSKRIRNLIQKTEIIDRDKIEQLDKIIRNKEVSLFNY